MHRDPVDIIPFTALLDDSAKQIASQFGINFVSSINNADSEISLDAHVVMQVFENLVANAARYATSQVNARFIIREASMDIAVTDDGPGFSNEALNKAALPFTAGICGMQPNIVG